MAAALTVKQQAKTCGYDLLEKRGAGGYGTVYQAVNDKQEIFAYKYTKFDDKWYLKIGISELLEMDVLSRIAHPHIIHASNIVTPFNCSIKGVALIMPLASATLPSYWSSTQATLETKIDMLYKLACAVDFLHDNNILHLDIKGENCVVKDGQPYLIDFGLSIVTDDIRIPRKVNALKVTLPYRPPEVQMKNYKYSYSGAVDVWSFGVMTFMLLCNRKYTDVFKIDWNDEDDLERKYFASLDSNVLNPEYLKRVLDFNTGQYAALCLDFVRRTVVRDPTQRLTAKQMVAHPLFDSVRTPIVGRTLATRVSTDYEPDFRNSLKYMVNWCLAQFPEEDAYILFLAVDLMYRVSSYFTKRSAIDRMVLLVTCLLMAIKLYSDELTELDDLLPRVRKEVPEVTGEKVLKCETELIHLLTGILNVNSIYWACSNGDELAFCFREILLSKDSTLYARVDVPQLKIMLGQMFADPKHPSRVMKIKDLLNY
jgi:serine/threonine protein kinase